MGHADVIDVNDADAAGLRIVEVADAYGYFPDCSGIYSGGD
jgi:hypothetical protein